MVSERALHETLPAIATSVPALRRAVARMAAEAGAGEELLIRLRLAVSEAVTNAVLHAYSDRPEPGPVHVAATVDRGLLEVTVADEGGGMKPRIDSPGIGMGLPIIAQSVETLDVQLLPAGGTELRMTFSLAG